MLQRKKLLPLQMSGVTFHCALDSKTLLYCYIFISLLVGIIYRRSGLNSSEHYVIRYRDR